MTPNGAVLKKYSCQFDAKYISIMVTMINLVFSYKQYDLHIAQLLMPRFKHTFLINQYFVIAKSFITSIYIYTSLSDIFNKSYRRAVFLTKNYFCYIKYDFEGWLYFGTCFRVVKHFSMCMIRVRNFVVST